MLEISTREPSGTLTLSGLLWQGIGIVEKEHLLSGGNYLTSTVTSVILQIFSQTTQVSQI